MVAEIFLLFFMAKDSQMDKDFIIGIGNLMRWKPDTWCIDSELEH